MAARKAKRIQHDRVVIVFAARLRELRKQRALTQAELAQRAGIHATYLRKLESGRSSPGVDLVQRLADALQVSIADLLSSRTRDPLPYMKEQARSTLEQILRYADESTVATVNSILALLNANTARKQ